ncbi:galactose mutarotase, partial [Francisella tularensis subsp. holarctica]|nr:galactose mutarotase [Francisella tularensis subsp. holarctica]
ATAYKILNINNLCYYNLSGDYKTTILDYQLKVPATQFVNVDEYLIPIDIQDLPKQKDLIQKT